MDGPCSSVRPGTTAGIRGTVDVAWPDKRVVLELDGRKWHTMTRAFEDDRRRDQLGAAAGWQTIRASWQQVTARPDELVQVLRSVLGPKPASASYLSLEANRYDAEAE